MSLSNSLQELRTQGFNTLYAVYGSLVDIVTIVENQPELLLQGTESVVYSELSTLVFNLTTYEIERYGIGVGVEAKKFVVRSDVNLIIKAEYLIKYDDNLYEVIEKDKRNSFNEWRIIGNRIQNV